MKIEELVYKVAGETLGLLEEKFHYRIPEDHKTSIQREVADRLDAMLKEEAKAEE